MRRLVKNADCDGEVGQDGWVVGDSGGRERAAGSGEEGDYDLDWAGTVVCCSGEGFGIDCQEEEEVKHCWGMKMDLVQMHEGLS